MRREHAGAIAELQAARSREAADARAALDAEMLRRRRVEEDLALEKEARAAERSALQSELHARTQAHKATQRQLDMNARRYASEHQESERAWGTRLSELSSSAQHEQQQLNAEVDRLRQVQEAVLQKACALPGGEARKLLFYEALKSRKQPESSLTWRGQTARPTPHIAQSMAVRRLTTSGTSMAESANDGHLGSGWTSAFVFQ